MLTDKRIDRIMKVLNSEIGENSAYKIILMDKYKFRDEGYTWYCSPFNKHAFEIGITKNYIGRNFYNDEIEYNCKVDFLRRTKVYFENEFNFDKRWFELDLENTFTMIFLLHELSHSLIINRTNKDYFDFLDSVDEDYDRIYNSLNYIFASDEKQDIMYREIPFEYEADKLACELFKKYSFKLMSIITGKSQKTLKEELEKIN